MKHFSSLHCSEPDSCNAFFTSPNVRDFRYAKNQIQKVERSKKGIASLDKLFAKAATAFQDAATFFKDCSDPRALPVYEGLRFDQIKRKKKFYHDISANVMRLQPLPVTQQFLKIQQNSRISIAVKPNLMLHWPAPM